MTIFKKNVLLYLFLNMNPLDTDYHYETYEETKDGEGQDDEVFK